MMSATKQKIFDISVELFSQKGFSAVSVREIARKVGIKESSLYNHYENKDDILTKIFDYYETIMEKSTPSEEYLVQKINALPTQEFWEKGLAIFQQATQKSVIQKISKIVLLEMFRNERARDIALNEFFTRQQNLTETIFSSMQKRGLIKKELNPKILTMEYTYGMLAMQFQYNILSNWNLPTNKIRKMMLDHIKFISDYAKSPKVGEE
jgi:AcrR family transcriptional regulator